MSIYRRIYEHHYGPIPTDSEGRTYDIHHIDGNRSNNEPSNIMALSKQEHYELHLSQGDKGAAMRLANELKRAPKEISELSRETQLKKVKNGTHHFLGGDLQKKHIKDGTHIFIKNNPVYKMIDEGTHHFLGGDLQRKQQKRLLQEGNHHSQKEYICPYCKKTGKGNGFKRFHFDRCKEKKI
jgi:hypothetical protein